MWITLWKTCGYVEKSQTSVFLFSLVISFHSIIFFFFFDFVFILATIVLFVVSQHSLISNKTL